MARKKANAKSDPGSLLKTTSTAATERRGIIFPDFAVKVDLECQTILDDQILVIEVDLLSAAECKAFVKFIDSLPLELTPPKKRGEADRVNERFSVLSSDFANKLYERLNPHLPESLPCPPSMKRRPATDDLEISKPHSCNPNIRVYKYTPSQYFGPHYDDSVRDPLTGAKSEWTILIYITGTEDGVEGGETLFYKERNGKARETISPPLKRGSALLHRHGQECMLHEGSPVKSGTKYVLRSDLMFKR